MIIPGRIGPSLLLILQLAAACESESETPAPARDASTQDAQPDEADSAAAADAAAHGDAAPAKNAEPAAVKASDSGFSADADLFAWRTEEFTLAPGEEQYLCYASTLKEDMVVNGYASEVAPFVHHLIFSRERQPKPEGFEVCDVTFRQSWEVLFLSGAGDTKLEFPDDAGNVLKAGEQLVLQMHLLNTSDKPVSSKTLINMRRTAVENPRPVSSAVFGTAAVELPAQQKSEVVGTCAVKRDVHLIAGFPHMHLLGTSMRFETGKSADSLKQVFKRDPFDFDNQRIEKIDVELSAGDMTRVTCSYDNPHDQTITYGESTLNEMCFFIGFSIDSRGGCLEVAPTVTR